MTEPPRAAPEVLALFPTPVWQWQLPEAVHGPLNGRLLAALAGLRPEHPPGRGWQSPRDLHRHPPFAGLAAQVEAAAAQVAEALHLGTGPLRITGCWANLNRPGTAHPLHAHPNNYLSGVYYLRTPPGADILFFHDPRPQAGVLRPPVTALGAHNADLVALRVREGLLLLFPAYLPHSVPASEAVAEERASISFNLMFEDFAAGVSPPLW